ncbi:MAG: response regulator transcription factor [Firmicutes bacterium]|nr:response regulator transcription factor [Bacillota bacterium]
MNKKILLLEDDPGLADGLSYSLEKNGFILDKVANISTAKKYISENASDYDLLILDIMLPDGTGFEICEYVRNIGNSVPIIFLTASDEETDIIRGLDCGGDDYIIKPFKLSEFLSRINALLRRAGLNTRNNSAAVQNPSLISCGGISVDLEKCKVLVDGRTISLTSSEYRLICLFIQNRGQILTRSIILTHMWDSAENFVDDNTLSVYIRRLREKIEKDPSRPSLLTTIRGFGYLLNE